MKNIRKRKDGRYEWRKQINLIPYQIINKNKKVVESKVRQLLKQLKNNYQTIQKTKTFINLAWQWFNTYKKEIKSGSRYSGILKLKFDNNPIFSKEINKITYEELEYFITHIKEHRQKAYCYYIIKGVYEEANKLKLIKENISQIISKPKNQSETGNWFTIKEQKLILDNLHMTPIKNEIMFYLMTGCRREEAINIKSNDINFDNNTIYINGTKTKKSKRYVNISNKYAEILKNNFENMFKKTNDYYTKTFQNFITHLGITNKKLHDLRHTFSTNLFYLEIPDKKRQYLLGHSSISITNDIYTHLDPNIKKEDILNLYKDLYPEF